MSDPASAGEPSPAVAPTPTPDAPDLACRDVVELVTDYLDGALDPPLAAAVELHLALCPPCVEYVRQIRHTSRVLGDVPAETVPEQVRLQLLVAFRGFRPPGADGETRAPEDPASPDQGCFSSTARV